MKRLFAIFMLAAAGLVAACTDPVGTGAPDITTPPEPLPTEDITTPTVAP